MMRNVAKESALAMFLSRNPSRELVARDESVVSLRVFEILDCALVQG
jgi:hypothetical protein